MLDDLEKMVLALLRIPFFSTPIELILKLSANIQKYIQMFKKDIH